MSATKFTSRDFFAMRATGMTEPVFFRRSPGKGRDAGLQILKITGYSHYT